MSLLDLFQWFEYSSLLVEMRSSPWLFPVIAAIHLLGLAVIGGAVLVVDLRLVGVTMLGVPASEVMARLLPWTVTGFAVMVVSGSLLFYAAPLDKYENLFFRTKMGLLVLAGVNVWVFYKTVYRRVVEWDLDPAPPGRARVAGGVGLVLWAAIITAGRMIPYQTYWFD